MVYMQNDRVVYVGSKFGELTAAVGYVVAPVQNDPGKYVVEFGGEGYVMSYKSLNPYRGSGKEDKVPEVMPVRRRRSEDDE
jgi:hypothetical protein